VGRLAVSDRSFRPWKALGEGLNHGYAETRYRRPGKACLPLLPEDRSRKTE